MSVGFKTDFAPLWSEALLTNAIKDTVSVLYWYEELSCFDRQFLEKDSLTGISFFVSSFFCRRRLRPRVGFELCFASSHQPAWWPKSLSSARSFRPRGCLSSSLLLWKALESAHQMTPLRASGDHGSVPDAELGATRIPQPAW